MTMYDLIRRLLGHTPGPEDGISESEITSATEAIGRTIPPPLFDLYRLAGKNSLLMTSFNEFALPSELREEGDKTVFLAENQGVCS